MCNIRFDNLELDHIVEFTKDSTVFVAARENGHGKHLKLFLVHNNTGDVYTRNGRAQSWEELLGSNRDSILTRLLAARNGDRVPTYKINGSHN